MIHTAQRFTGIDLAKGHDISTLDLFRLAANAEFRKAQKDMYDELEKAGFDAKVGFFFLSLGE